MRSRSCLPHKVRRLTLDKPMSKNKTIKSNAKHIIAITALFFLGISNASANQSTCAATGNLTVANADSLLDEDNSAAAYAWLNVGMELGYGENNNYPPIGSKESGESYQRAADMFERGYVLSQIIKGQSIFISWVLSFGKQNPCLKLLRNISKKTTQRTDGL